MSTPNLKLFFHALVATGVLTLLACNGSGSTPGGTLNLAIADTPVDGATSVLITFTGVEIKPGGHGDARTNGLDNEEDDDNTPAPGGSTSIAPSGSTNTAPGGSTTTAPGSSTGMGDDQGDDDQGEDDNGDHAKPLEFNFPSPVTVDLLKQQGGSSASLLNGVKLPAGHYEWIRLKLATTNCCTISLSDGSVHPLVVASGDETGLKLVRGFTVATDGTVNFTIDFDLRHSIVLANGVYFLKPVLRLMDNLQVGGIEGTAQNTLSIGGLPISDPSCGPAAYIYAGANVMPVDIAPGAAVQPVTTATLSLDDDNGDFRFKAGFLAPGAYTVALVCAAKDDPTKLDNLTFSATKNATVTADMATEVDFP